MTDSAENFWQAWSAPWPTPVSVCYRLYYNTQGYPVCYTMDDLPGDWIEIDQQTYLAASFDVRVADQKLIHLPRLNQVHRLKPNQTQGTACDPRDICVVVDTSKIHTKWNYQ